MNADSIEVNDQQEQQGGREESVSAASPNGSGTSNAPKKKRGPPADGRRHLSCENCRIRKMRCSRTEPCLACRMRGDECVWIGAAPNGSANEDEVEATGMEVNRLKKLVDLLLTRLEQQDTELERHFPTGNLPPPAASSRPGPPSSNSVPSSSSHHRTSIPYDPHRPQPDQSGVRSFGFASSASDILVEDRLAASGVTTAAGPASVPLPTGAEGYEGEYYSQYHTQANGSRDVWDGGPEPMSTTYQSQYR
ncbi:hypothetical protein JCM16303_004454 [Sporobolomyces ruberrimus]